MERLGAVGRGEDDRLAEDDVGGVSEGIVVEVETGNEDTFALATCQDGIPLETAGGPLRGFDIECRDDGGCAIC
jgi:hypothetical protein